MLVHWRRRLWPYLLLAVLALPAAWPFFLPGLPRSNDHLPHFYRALELAQLVRAGIWFPRWAPDLVHGFGYPVFNFFPYLGHYLPVLFSLLGLEFLNAFKAACVLVIVLSGWFAFRLAREHFGETAGMVAGVAYMYSPYLLYDLHVRGSLPETLALALIPLAMVYLRRAAQGQTRGLVEASITLGAFIFTHHGVALQTMPFLGLYTLWQVWTFAQRPVAGHWRLVIRSAVRGLAPFGFSLLLSAFFWLPAWQEARYAQIEHVTLNQNMSFFDSFLSIPELLAWPRIPVDPALLNPPVVRSLPLAVLIGWAAGAVALAAIQRRQALSTLSPSLPWLLLAGTATLIVMPIARPLWEHVRLLQYTLFPWRLLGPIGLFGALALGSLFAPASPAGRGPVVVASLCLLVAAGLPLASPPRETVPSIPTLADLAAFEIPPDFIGTTSVGEYRPIWVTQMPDTQSDREALMRGIQPLRYTAPGAEVAVAAANPLTQQFVITAATSLTFTFRVFYFPGWTATIDGQPITITITTPEGLMAVGLPAGTHRLVFHFGDTPPRQWGVVLSTLGWVALAVLALRPAATLPPLPRLTPGTIPYLPIGLTAIALAVARPWLYDTGLTPLLTRSDPATNPALVTHRLNQDFSGELTLLGWEAKSEHLGADESVTVNLYWKATHPLGVAYGFDVRLIDPSGYTSNQPDPARPRDWRFIPGTDNWPSDQYLIDSYIFTPLAGTQPGEYRIRVTVFALYNLQAIGTVELGPLTITTPSRRSCANSNLGQLDPSFQWETADFSKAQAAPGDFIEVTLCGQIVHTTTNRQSLELQLVGSGGQVESSTPLTLTTPAQTGESQRHFVTVRLPATLKTGSYQWELANQARVMPVGSLQVETPRREFAAPAASASLQATLGPAALWGVTVPAVATPGGSAAIELIWQAINFMDVSYRVFVHCTDANGQIVAQSDGTPADWTRPTTGWLPGEYVVDQRRLILPAGLPVGTYTLTAGLYDPQSGNRLTTAAYPDGRIPLGTLLVQNNP